MSLGTELTKYFHNLGSVVAYILQYFRLMWQKTGLQSVLMVPVRVPFAETMKSIELNAPGHQPVKNHSLKGKF
jgi:hypothetical protein